MYRIGDDVGVPITFRPLQRTDFPEVTAWMDDPEVARWWPDPHSIDDLEVHYGAGIDGQDPTEVFIIEIGGEAAGLAQRYLTAEYLDWQLTMRDATPELLAVNTAGIDYLLGRPDVRQRGIGTRMLVAFTAKVFEDLGDVDAVVVAVQQANRPSWRALERAGYQRVWAGRLASADPSDAGAAYVLTRRRAQSPGGAGGSDRRPASGRPASGRQGS